MRDEAPKNAKIRSTMFGFEDHGIMTFFLNLEGDEWGCGFGGLRCDGPGLAEAIKQLLKTVEVDTWERLGGQFVRVKFSGGRAESIGHLMKDQWVSVSDLSAIIGGAS